LSKLLDDLKRATAARHALGNTYSRTDRGNPVTVRPDIGMPKAEGMTPASRPNAWIVGAWTVVALLLGIALGTALRSPPAPAPQPGSMRPITKADDGPRLHLRMETALDRAAPGKAAARQ